MIGMDVDRGNDVGHMFNDWGMGWAGGWMILLWVALLAVIVWAIIALTRAGKSSATEANPTAAQLLDQRLARGEIGEREYRQIRDVLREGSHTGR